MIIVSNLTFTKIRQIGIGQGMNSEVWLVHDFQFDCEFAVKEIDKSQFWNSSCFAEAQALHAVEHPHIVRVRYGCELGNSAFIAMPYYPNGSLADLLKIGPLDLSGALTLAQEVLLGLTHIHACRFLHLDIKPSNIFIDDHGRALIGDFGQSRQIDASGQVMQPTMYKRLMPPEVIQSGRASYVSDIYQVGALLYRALNGEADWQEQLANFSSQTKLQAAITTGKFPNRDRFLPHIPKRLRTVLRKALSTDVGQRHATAAAFASELGKIQVDRDWRVAMSPSGDISWTCQPVGAAHIRVELIHTFAGWKTEVYTESGGSPRAKGRDSLWGRYSSRKEGLAALKPVFERL